MKSVKNYIFSLALSLGAGLVLSTTAGATTGGLPGVKTAVDCMCWQLLQILPIIAMLMIIGAGIVYAAGQIMGAETRARASQWGTAMLIGAVIAILIVTVAPPILSLMYGTAGSVNAGTTMCMTAC